MAQHNTQKTIPENRVGLHYSRFLLQPTHRPISIQRFAFLKNLEPNKSDANPRSRARADYALQAAQAGIEAAVKDVLRSYAEELAGRVEEHEAAAADGREKLGIHGYSFLSRFLSSKSNELLARVMAGTGP